MAAEAAFLLFKLLRCSGWFNKIWKIKFQTIFVLKFYFSVKRKSVFANFHGKRSFMACLSSQDKFVESFFNITDVVIDAVEDVVVVVAPPAPAEREHDGIAVVGDVTDKGDRVAAEDVVVIVFVGEVVAAVRKVTAGVDVVVVADVL